MPIRTLVHETAGAPLTGVNVSLSGPVTSRRSFASYFADGAEVFYFIDDGVISEWGKGVFSLGSPNSVSRATVWGNSAGNTSRLNFTGTVNIYNEIPAEMATYAGSNWAGTAGGAANALTVTTPYKFAGVLPPDGAEVEFILATTNSTAVTLTWNGGTTKNLYRANGAALVAGTLNSGGIIKAKYCFGDYRLIESKTPVGLVGEIKAFAGSTIPSEYLICAGQAVSRTTYATLFSAIGATWGAGNGTTTFNVPDLRGRALFGKDDMNGSAAGRITAGESGITGTTLAAVGGDQRQHSHAHSVYDPGHVHSASSDAQGFHGHSGTTDEQGNHAHGYDFADASGNLSFTSPGAGGGGRANNATTTAGNHSHNLLINGDGSHAHNIFIGGAGTGVAIYATGAGNSQNMPPAAIVNMMIYAGA